MSKTKEKVIRISANYIEEYSLTHAFYSFTNLIMDGKMTDPNIRILLDN